MSLSTFSKHLILPVISFGYIGLTSKKCPGTLGSGAASLIVYFTPQYYLFTFSLLFVIIGTLTSQLFVSHYSTNKDPGFIIIDEVAAIFLCNSISYYLNILDYTNILLNFIFFRIFDIWKPWLIRSVDQFCKTKKYLWGIGVMLDDILSVIPTVICSTIFYLFITK